MGEESKEVYVGDEITDALCDIVGDEAVDLIGEADVWYSVDVYGNYLNVTVDFGLLKEVTSYDD